MPPSHFMISVSFFIAMAGLAFHRTHLLSALLCLEAVMLSLFVALALWTMELSFTSFSCTPLILLTFSASEASVGLALLVATTRTHGSDELKALNLLQC
uniref:NADH-ubiquinone oxidoreductase chain 4L n=1 Tax=Brachygobius kabiliensis TaxID=228545 RepID=A0A1S5QIV1_9GOBI|nr:NADH dehydrogenase subunit 4L [Brachygobius kabiliensis]